MDPVTWILLELAKIESETLSMQQHPWKYLSTSEILKSVCITIFNGQINIHHHDIFYLIFHSIQPMLLLFHYVSLEFNIPKTEIISKQ